MGVCLIMPIGQPDYVNQLLIPLGADLLLFILKGVVVLLLAGFFMRKYVAPLFKKETKVVEEPSAPVATSEQQS
jgi:hypothetical protein